MTASLPLFLQEIARLTSIRVALTLVQEFGGTRVHFPSRARARDKLSRCVGLEAARLLVRAYGGTYRDMPRWAAKKKRAIARETGSAARIAREYQVTERWVRKVRNGRRADDGQLDLLRKD